LKDRKNNYLHVNIIFFSIGAREQKLCPSKFKTKDKGQQKIQDLNLLFLKFFSRDYISVYKEIFDLLHLDFLLKNYKQSCFSGN